LVVANSLAMVKHLEAKGADLFVRPGATEPTVLWHFYHWPDILEYCITRGVDVNARSQGMNDTVLFAAASSGNLESVSLLLKHGARLNDRDAYGWSVLHRVCERGKTETAELLIARGAGINSTERYGVTPLMIAAWKGHAEIVSLLLKHGADASVFTRKFSREEFSALKDAEDFFFLKTNLSHMRTKSIDALIMAIFGGDLECVKYLRAVGRDINYRMEKNITLPMVAAALGETDIVAYLASAGADLSVKDDFGMTALSWARRMKQTKTAEAITRLLKQQP